MLEGKGSRDEPVRLGPQHQEFLELCALASSGSLNEAEAEKLREHLLICSGCREAIKEFDAVVDGILPELTRELNGDTFLDPSFSQEKAEAFFQNRLTEEKEREQSTVATGTTYSSLVARRRPFFLEYFYRSEVWLPLVASALLCATFGMLSYRMGRNHGITWARLEQVNKPAVEAVVVKALPPNTDVLDRELAALSDLRRKWPRNPATSGS